MAEKKLAQIAVHVSEDVKCLMSRLADAEGMTLSEYVHALLIREIEGKRNLMMTLNEAFAACEGTVSRGERL
jgi:hypothetical protein